jgi:hypothetical protein
MTPKKVKKLKIVIEFYIILKVQVCALKERILETTEFKDGYTVL